MVVRAPMFGSDGSADCFPLGTLLRLARHDLDAVFEAMVILPQTKDKGTGQRALADPHTTSPISAAIAIGCLWSLVRLAPPCYHEA